MGLPDDVQVVSVDDHVIEPASVWEERLPKKFLEAGPHNRRSDEGADVWWFEGKPGFPMGLNAVAGKPRERFGDMNVNFDDMRRGCWDPKARLQDMDRDGVHAQLCFPTFPGFAGSTFFQAKDKELATACVIAYNDWVIGEWCGSMPGRQIPLALVPFWDIDATVAEAERVAGKGAKGISFTEAPHALGLPSFHTDHWDRFLAVAEEAQMTLSMHFGSGGAPTVAPEAPFTTAIALFGLNSQMTTVDLVNSKVFERFPRLKVALSEGGIGWIPYILERADYTWERHRYWTGMADAKRPSEIFRENIFGCFIYDDSGLANLDRIGVDNVMFESDYPHSDSNWPQSREMLTKSLAAVPDDVARKIAEDNARRVYNFPREEVVR